MGERGTDLPGEIVLHATEEESDVDENKAFKVRHGQDLGIEEKEGERKGRRKDGKREEGR